MSALECEFNSIRRISHGFQNSNIDALPDRGTQAISSLAWVTYE
jgi:hypothetical protein